jgi:protein-S-isoprenylcysteine O-methyltransferase Ste14
MNALRYLPPPVHALLLLAFCRFLDKLWPIPADLSSMPLALLLSLAGGGLVLWAWRHFLRERTTLIPTGQPSALVVGGPYRFTRNPMYLGIALALAGLAFYLGALPYLLAPLGFFFIVKHVFVPYEEKRLEEAFGEDYRRLLETTPRWFRIPWK